MGPGIKRGGGPGERRGRVAQQNCASYRRRLLRRRLLRRHRLLLLHRRHRLGRRRRRRRRRRRFDERVERRHRVGGIARHSLEAAQPGRPEPCIELVPELISAGGALRGGIPPGDFPAAHERKNERRVGPPSAEMREPPPNLIRLFRRRRSVDERCPAQLVGRCEEAFQPFLLTRGQILDHAAVPT